MLWTKVLSALKGLTYPEIFPIVMFGEIEVLHKSISVLCNSKQHYLLYTTLIWSAQIVTVLLEGICAILNSHIQALKLYIYYYIDVYLKDGILALSWGAQKLNACTMYQLYSIVIFCHRI